MTDFEIEEKFEMKVKEERRVTYEVVELIAMVEDRKIFAARGYPSLFEWLTRKYGYSEGAANRRISAARLLRSVPELKTKLESGDLNLTSVAKAHSIIRASEKAGKRALPQEIKMHALKEIENKSTVQAEQILLSIFPEAASNIQRTQVRQLDSATSRLSANVPNEVMGRYQQIRDLISHSVPNASFVEAADYLFKKLLKEKAAAAKRGVRSEGTATVAKHCVKTESAAKQSVTGEAPATAAKQSVNKSAAAAKRGVETSGTIVANQRVNDSVSAAKVNNDNKTITPRTKRIVLQGQSCTFRDPQSGKVCGSRYQLQVDHRHPKALGGTNHSDNLRPFCSTHNRLMAEQTLGKAFANKWREGRPHT